ncbi:MAG: hypothetical protein AABX01_03075 [Candidatus Micrarchaeota archaeon]
MPSKKPNQPHFNLFLIVVIIALFGVGIYILISAQKGPTAIIPTKLLNKDPVVEKKEYLQALNAKYEPDTLEYVDSPYGYKLRYPIGYDAVIEPFPGIHQRFAAFYPPVSMELIDIRIFKPTELSSSTIEAAAKEFKTIPAKEKIGGKDAFIINAKVPSITDELEDVYIKQAFYECSNSSNFRYWLSFTAGISEALAGDLELADYMIHSVEC